VTSEQPRKQSPPIRILIGKVGLDGHDRGAKYIAHVLRDAGYEVIYTGIRHTPKEVIETALQEDVALLGLSLLSGAHNSLLKQVTDLLKEHGATDILVVAGGPIPAADIPSLTAMGVAAVFTPGTSSQTILETFATLFAARQHAHDG
jgi:methylmalonyl-CoA mutase C-terminal domain/subunit